VILLLIVIIGVSVVTYIVLSKTFPRQSNTKTIWIVACAALILVLFLGYKIYVGFHTLPEGARYIEGEN
jgi:predicted ABC-type exoprotein transport system permease subunit